MNAGFNVWLLIVGLIVGAGLVWLVVMDARRNETEIDAKEQPREAAWLSAVLSEDGFDVSPKAAERLLVLHRAYLGASPPDEIVEDGSTAPGHRPPPRTGFASTAAPEASTSETPNEASPNSPETAGTGPIQ